MCGVKHSDAFNLGNGCLGGDISRIVAGLGSYMLQEVLLDKIGKVLATDVMPKTMGVLWVVWG